MSRVTTVPSIVTWYAAVWDLSARHYSWMRSNGEFGQARRQIVIKVPDIIWPSNISTKIQRRFLMHVFSRVHFTLVLWVNF